MTLHATARPQQLSTAGAIFRVLVTLLLFLVVFIAFLIAPLIALGLAYLVYVVWRSRGGKQKSSTDSARSSDGSVSGFGAGV